MNQQSPKSPKKRIKVQHQTWWWKRHDNHHFNPIKRAMLVKTTATKPGASINHTNKDKQSHSYLGF